MRAIITSPVRDHVAEPTRQAIFDSGIPWINTIGVSDLPRARCALLTNALNQGADRIICLDADIICTSQHLKALAEHPGVSTDVAVSGLYSVRSGKTWACGERSAVDDSGLQAVAFSGLGFCCIQATSLRRLADSLCLIHDPEFGDWWPFCVPFVIGYERCYYADDMSLWQRLGEQGTVCKVDPSLVVGHVAQITLMSPMPSSL